MAKCHPAIFDFAALSKESIEGLKALGPKPPRELIAELEARIDKRLKEIHKKYSGPTPPAPNTFATQIIFSEEALKSESDAQGMAQYYHWERHKKTLKQDAEKSRKKDLNASRRILRTISDLEQLRCGKGPLPPFKGDLEHSTMFEGLWGFGIEKLSPEELADFFDYYCPCGRDHDADALANQRERFYNSLNSAAATTQGVPLSPP